MEKILGQKTKPSKASLTKAGRALCQPGRRKPYTEIGIRRLACARCGAKPAVHQWNCCALGNLWIPLCLNCDIDLNRLTMIWLNVRDREVLLDAYVLRGGAAQPLSAQ